MNDIADRFSEQGVGSIFLYTNEAHPGENYPHLTSMEQKFRHARDLRDQLGVTRPILLDALDGACRRAYGSMPNMSWIFNKAGIPIYKSDWSDARSVENDSISAPRTMMYSCMVLNAMVQKRCGSSKQHLSNGN